MPKSLKKNRTFSLEQGVLSAIEKTKGSKSASEHANDLLRSALAQQRYAALEREAAEFYRSEPRDLKERKAWFSATIKAIAKD